MSLKTSVLRTFATSAEGSHSGAHEGNVDVSLYDPVVALGVTPTDGTFLICRR